MRIKLLRSEERRVGKERRYRREPRDWSSDVCSSDLVAKKSGSSPSAVVRLSKTLGYNGFADLKVQLAMDLKTPIMGDFSEMIQKEDTFKTIIYKAEHANKAT